MKCFCVGHDSSRAAVGCADQRIYVYSLHSAQLLRTLAAAHDLSALAIADKDHFLLAAGKDNIFHINYKKVMIMIFDNALMNVIMFT